MGKINTCAFEPESFQSGLEEILAPLINDSLEDVLEYDGQITDNIRKGYLHWALKRIGETFGITRRNVEEATELAGDILYSNIEEHLLPDEDDFDVIVGNDLTSNTSGTPVQEAKEELTTQGLINQEFNEEAQRRAKFNDDIFTSNYGKAMDAKIMAKRMGEDIIIKSCLVSEDGRIVQNESQLNEEVRKQQQKLLDKVLLYLRNRLKPEVIEKNPDIFGKGLMYDKNGYTGIVELIQDRFGGYLSKDSFTESELDELSRVVLSRYGNVKAKTKLDGYNAWVLLTNFDTLLERTFGKAININPEYSKYTHHDKYSMSKKGSNVYQTWRTSDEIFLSKEVNNIVQLLITHCPYLVKKGESMGDVYVKFNQFEYIISKIKDLLNNLRDSNYVFAWDQIYELGLSERTVDIIQGKSMQQLLGLEGTDPQLFWPAIFEILDNESLYNRLIGDGGPVQPTYFDETDQNIIHSLSEGIFSESSPNSLYSINLKSGLDRTNYFSYITQVTTSVFGSKYLQYFKDNDGNIYVRNMFDQSINNIRRKIEQNVSALNSRRITNYDEWQNGEYQVQMNYTSEFITPDMKLSSKKGKELDTTIDNVTLGNWTGTLVVKNENGTLNYYLQNKETGDIIASKSDLDDFNLVTYDFLAKQIESFKGISFIIPHFSNLSVQDVDLQVDVDIKTGNVTTKYGGKKVSLSNSSWESISPFVEDVLRLNFENKPQFFNHFKNLNGEDSEIAEKLLGLASRVLMNSFVSGKILVDGRGKMLTEPNAVKEKLKSLYGTSAPVYNKNIAEINMFTDADRAVLGNLAWAQALAEGTITSSQVKDGNGNAMSSCTLSRLLGSYRHQWEIQNKQPNSATRNFHLLRNGVLKQVYAVKDFKDIYASQSKSSLDMTSQEMEEGSFLYDFVSGLIEDPKNNKTLGNGIIALLASVNADKGNIGRLVIDLNKEVSFEYGGETVTAKIIDILMPKQTGWKTVKGKNESYSYRAINKDTSMLEEFIRQEMKDYFDQAYANINEEWRKVYEAAIQQGKLQRPGVEPTDYQGYMMQNLNTLGGMNKLNDIIKRNNLDYPNSQIVLIDQVHYVEDGNQLVKNRTFETLRNRFSNPQATADFFYEQSISTLGNLLKDDFSIVIPLDEDVEVSPEVKLLRRNLKGDWIDVNSNKLILAKIGDKNITKTADLFSLASKYNIPIKLDNGDIRNPIDIIQDIIKQGNEAFTFNPFLANYNEIQYLFSQEWLFSTVGSHYAHPAKAFTDELVEEASRYNAQNKRNVSMTAAMHAFQKGLLSGIPSDYNIAIIRDVKDTQYNVSGEIDGKVKPYDGATFVNPFIVYLENASLGGAAAGVVKKQFVHFYDEKTGTGGIIKTAGFGLTNDLIKNSVFYQTMMYNMTHYIWRNEDGSAADIDITQNWKNQSIQYYNSGDKNGNKYFRDQQTGKYYRIDKIEKVGVNQYKRTLTECDQNGVAQSAPILEQEAQTVNSNYTLWQLFGGENSVEIMEGNTTFTPSEYSIQAVVNAMNSVGTVKAGYTIDQVRSQSQLYQPLKHSDVHYMPTEGAVKQGAGNINGKECYTDLCDLNIMRIHMNQAGIQLDKEHHADNERLSQMTQVISSCAARGYTPEEAMEMYQALSSLTELGISEYIDSFKKYFEDPNNEENKDAFQKAITDTIVDALIHQDNSDSDILSIITQKLMDKAKEGKEIKFKDIKGVIPYSDPGVFRKVASTINVALTKSSIKIKIPGLLSVLCPSFGIMKLYGNKKLEAYPHKQALEEAQRVLEETAENNLVSRIHDVELGRHYKIYGSNLENTLQALGSGEIKTDAAGNQYIDFNLVTPVQYNALRNIIDPDPNEYSQEDALSYDPFYEGNIDSELFKNPFSEGGLNVGSQERADELFEALLRGEEEYSGINLGFYVNQRDAILQKIESGALDNIPLQYVKAESEGKARIIGNLIREKKARQHGITKIVENIVPGRDLANYNVRFTANGRRFQIWDLESVQKLFKLKGQKGYDQEEAIRLTRKVQEDLQALTKAKDQSIVQEVTLTGGRKATVEPDSIEIQPYEIVMPKIFASVFGLETYDSVDEILRDPDFFTKRIIQRYTKSIPSGFFDLELKRINGNHMYFLQRDRAVVSENFRRKEIKTIVEKGKVFRCNDKGDIMYQLSVTAEDVEKGLKQDEVWEYISPDGKVTEVIVTGNLNDNNNISDYNNLKHYIDKNGFVSVNISSRIDDVSKYVDILRRSKNKSAKRFVRFLRSQGSDVKSTIKELNKTLSDINDSLGKGNFKLTAEELTNPAIRMIHEIGIETHTSFQQSLDIIAARIPAQSMQSFMPMRVVAFDNPDRNTAYVSTAQIWLQGSDYDIDAVSLATYAIDKSGRFVGWSPYFNLQNVELLGASKRLPFPTGKEAKNGTWGLAYSDYIGAEQDESDKPFYLTKNGIQTRLNTYKRMQNFINLLKAINENGIPMPAERTVVLDVNGQSLSVPVGNCIEAIRDAVNEHNMYLKEVGKDELENMTKNFVLSREYMISSSPVNLIESQAPIDRQTQPLKDIGNQSPKALDSVRAIPGDFTTAIHAIVENQTGKKGVGICAVGLKSFFALTQYYNYLLNHGTAEQQENLKLGPKGSGVFVAGKYYNLLANARAENPNETITNKDVLRMITSVNNDKDAALVLSALLSLATDNAKELQLAKLNAGTNMLGMYVYGISIGMDFRDISDILMSPIGFKISSMMNDNVFSDDPRMNIQDIFDYFELGPRKKLNDFEITYLKDKHVTSPVVYLRRLILKEKGKTEKEMGKVKTYEVLKDYVDEILSKGDLAYAIGEVEKLRNNFKKTQNTELNAIFNRLMDFVETYVIEMDSKNNSLLFNSNKKAKLKKIISGAQTGADTIGLEVGLELGLETGGTAPPGFQREKYDDGYDAQTLQEKFGVHEISPELQGGKRGKEFYIPRTEQNVIDSDGTVYFYNGKPSPGYYATRKAAEKHGKPFVGIDVTQPNMYMLKNWMIKHNIETLNVAGNRASSFGDNGNVIREALTFAMTPTSYSAYNEFKKLSDGAEELKTFGQILHVNQGLPSSALELISLIDNIEGAISSRLYARYREAKRRNPHDRNIKLEDYRFNLHEFLYGDPSQANPREYTDSIIAAYEENKAAFNLLDAVDKVPHFRSYLQVADMAHQSLMKSSAKYRAIYNLGRYAIEQIGAKASADKESVYKRTESFVNDYLRRTWMLDRGIQIKVPYKQQFFDEQATPLDLVIGTEYYDILGVKKEVTSNLGMQIQLGIRVNDATFKMLMEKKIIPDLMKGYADSNRKHKVLLLESNLFIQSLAPALNSRTPNFNTIVGYSLPINMSPRSDEEIALFNRYKKAFNQLKNSGIKYKIGVNEYDIAELFYYYNQIAFQGRIGEETLTKIFEDSLDYKTIADFISYENDFDNNRDIILDKDIDEFDFVKAVAPKANPRSTNLQYFYSIDPQTGLMAFWDKAEVESYDDADIGPQERRTDVINGFEPHSLSVTEESAVNYFTTEAYDKKDLNCKEKMTISGKETDVDISINHDSGNINLIKLTATDNMANTILDEQVSFKQIGDKLQIKITDSRGREVLKREFVGQDARINKKIPIKFEFVEGNLTTVYDTKALADRINTLKNPC